MNFARPVPGTFQHAADSETRPLLGGFRAKSRYGPSKRPKQKVVSTLRLSQAVAHPSTLQALHCFTVEFRWDPVLSVQYGRQRESCCSLQQSSSNRHFSAVFARCTAVQSGCAALLARHHSKPITDDSSSNPKAKRDAPKLNLNDPTAGSPTVAVL